MGDARTPNQSRGRAEVRSFEIGFPEQAVAVRLLDDISGRRLRTDLVDSAVRGQDIRTGGTADARLRSLRC